jgi:GH24 family phage-related lysozyme (muramidase)
VWRIENKNTKKHRKNSRTQHNHTEAQQKALISTTFSTSCGNLGETPHHLDALERSVDDEHGHGWRSLKWWIGAAEDRGL